MRGLSGRLGAGLIGVGLVLMGSASLPLRGQNMDKAMADGG